MAISAVTERAEEIAEKCLKNGPLVSSSEDAVTMFPALTIDAETAERGLDILERVAHEVAWNQSPIL
jgi:4-aminobutyrate aminotransferase-like enzyme